MKRLDVEVAGDLVLLALHRDQQRMAADAHGQIVPLGQFDRLGQLLDRAGLDQAVAGHAPDVQGNGAGIDLLLDVVLQRLLVLSHLDLDVRDELHVPAEFAVVALDEIRPGLENRVDPVGLGQPQRLHHLLFRHVGAEQLVDVFQVAGVHIAGDQVAAQQQPADLGLADRAVRHRLAGSFGGWGRRCRFRRRGRSCGPDRHSSPLPRRRPRSTIHPKNHDGVTPCGADMLLAPCRETPAGSASDPAERVRSSECSGRRGQTWKFTLASS